MSWYKKSDVDIDKLPKSCKRGDCYCAAGRYLMEHGFTNPLLRLAHGEVTGQGKIRGIRYGHAWLEDGENIIDVSLGRFIQMPKAVYYAIGQIDEDKVFKYDIEQVTKKSLDTGHWGPWDLITKY